MASQNQSNTDVYSIAPGSCEDSVVPPTPRQYCHSNPELAEGEEEEPVFVGLGNGFFRRGSTQSRARVLLKNDVG